MVREQCGHDRDTSPINNHQRDLEIHNDSHTFNDETSDRVNHQRRNQFLLSRDILLVRDPSIGIHHT